MLPTPLERFRITALIEGYSYILLLFVAMPLKYFFDMPIAVKIAGSAHGGLFVLYILTLAVVFFKDKWKFSEGLIAFVASLVPFASFYIDKQLRRYKKPVLSSKSL
jgi:integral membrane protein